MIKSYFKIAFRNLRRNKSYAAINMLGLAIGIAACLLLFVVLRFETSFDNFHSKKNSIYRISTRFHNQDGVSYSDGVAFPAAPAIRSDFPQIKEVASIFRMGGQIEVQGSKGTLKKIAEDNFYYAEPGFFKMFNFGWLKGTPGTSLNNPNSAVLTQATAEKFFGDWRSAIGKTIKYQNKTFYTITGILKNVPVNSDFPLSIVVPYSAINNTSVKDYLKDWMSTYGGAYSFAILPPELPVQKFNAELISFAKKHKPAEYAKDTYLAQPLSEMHFDNRFGNFRHHTFGHSLVKALVLIIGVFLLLIVCLNFINLAASQAVNRSKEIGIRKVLGSNRNQLALQLLSETALVTIVASIAAIDIAAVALPFLNKFLEVQMSLNFVADPALILFVVAVAVAITLLSGIYPVIILSGFNPVTALNNRAPAKIAGGISIRRGLAILQFAIVHVLVIGVLIAAKQIAYFKNASLGFDKAAIINVEVPGDSASHTKTDSLRNQLLSNADIQNVSFSFESPSSENSWNSDFKFDHSAKATNFSANLKWADVEYFNTYRLQFVAGRPYYPSDTVREFVVNETLLKKLGIRNPKDAIGKEINFWNGGKVATIVGVIRDFNSFSLRLPMAPVVLSAWKDVYQTINIKIRPGKEKPAMACIEKLWIGAFPDYVYKYRFLDETIGNFYKQEDQLSQLYKAFAAVGIFMSCLGLYGLVCFMTAERTKEVGIRKVLGASARSIVYVLSKELTLLIIVAFAMAAPLAYYITNAWLQNYAYRIVIGTSIFISAVACSVIIIWITVGHRAIKAAMANPIKSLRNE